MDPPVKRPGQRPARASRIELRVTPAAHEAIASRAKKEERTFSDMVRILLMRGMEK